MIYNDFLQAEITAPDAALPPGHLRLTTPSDFVESMNRSDAAAKGQWLTVNGLDVHVSYPGAALSLTVVFPEPCDCGEGAGQLHPVQLLLWDGYTECSCLPWLESHYASKSDGAPACEHTKAASLIFGDSALKGQP